MKNKPKILYVNKQFRSYDVMKYYNLAKEFELNVIWLCGFRKDDYPSEELLKTFKFSVLNFRGSRLQPWHFITSMKLLLSTIKNNKSQLYISSTSDAWSSKIIFFCAKLLRKKVALRKEVWYENPLNNIFRKFNNLLTLFIERKSNAILIPGLKQKEFLNKKHNKNINTLIFPYLIDESLWNRNNNSKRFSEKVEFIFWGRLIPLKGVDLLIKVSKKLALEHKKFSLKIIGGGTNKLYQKDENLDYDSYCYKQAQNSNFIKFSGQLDNKEIIKEINNMSVFVMPNIKYVNGLLVGDGWGNALVEALCANMPLIASDRVASATHCIINNQNGFIINSEKLEDELYNAMLFFINNPQLLDSFSTRSKENVSTVNNPMTMIESINKIINEK